MTADDRWPDPARRILVTLGAVLAWRIGLATPLPGVASEALSSLGAMSGIGSIARLSILALGLLPYFSVLVIAEAVKLVFPDVLRWSQRDARNRRRLAGGLRFLALAVATVQALGIVQALQATQGNGFPLLQPGFEPAAAAIASLVAGTALMIWLSDVVTRSGLGHGVWILTGLAFVAELPGPIATMGDLVGSGAIDARWGVASAAWALAGLAALVVVAKANWSSGHADPRPAFALIPLPAGSWLAGYLVPLAFLLTGSDDAMTWMVPAYLLLQILLTGLFYRLVPLAERIVAESHGLVFDAAAAGRRAAASFAVVALILLTGALLPPLVAPTQFVVLVVAGIAAVEAARQRRPMNLA